VWSRDSARAARVARRLAVAAWASVDSPSSGWKASGPGHRHGRQALDVVTRTTTIAIQRMMPLTVPPGVASTTCRRVLTAMLRLMRRAPGR
jgi:succinate-semialdehyde dehydrogenase / glutarate-semialdehyde dehydrogenase